MWRRRVRYGSGPEEAFPYVFEEPRFVARVYERLRFESAPFSEQDALRGLLYFCKQRFGRWTYPRELIHHFLSAHDPIIPAPYAARCAGDEAELPSKPLRLMAIGDIMWLPAQRSDYLGPALRELLSSADLILGNLETPLSRLHPHGAHGRIVRFNSDPALLAPLLACRCPLALSVANNHSLDAGFQGLHDTLAVLAEVGVTPVGVEQGEHAANAQIQISGTRVSCLGFCGFVNPGAPQYCRPEGVDVHPNVVEDLVAHSSQIRVSSITSAIERERRRGADLVLIGLHWGYEHEFLPDPRQMVIARELIGAGADAILGHHPHVVQPMELLAGGRPVVYSLGNFISRMVGRDFWFGQVAELIVDRRSLAGEATAGRTGEPTQTRIRACYLHPIITYRAGDQFYVELLSALLCKPEDHPGYLRATRCQAFLWRFFLQGRERPGDT